MGDYIRELRSKKCELQVFTIVSRVISRLLSHRYPRTGGTRRVDFTMAQLLSS